MASNIDHDLVSVLRRPDGLFACRVQRTKQFVVLPPSMDQAPDPLGLVDPYVETVVPLRDVDWGQREPLKSALASWHALGHVQRLDGTTLFHLVNVLVHSLPDETAAKGVTPLAFEPEPPVFRPTAANPRAYKGTKDRPPKVKRPGSMDLRPHLSSARDVNELLVKLAPFHSEASRLLKKADILVGELPSLVDSKGRVQDVYLACLHTAGRESVLSLPPHFRRGFLFWQRGALWKQVTRVLALYWALGLESKASLRRCTSRLLVNAPTAGALDWWDLILEQPEERRTAFAELLIESKVCWEPCPPGLGGILRRANDVTPDRFYRHRMFALLASLRKGSDPEYLVSGIELSQDYHETYPFEPTEKSGNVPVEAIRAIAERSADKYLPMRLWDACAQLDGLDRLITGLPWLELTPTSASELLHLLANTVHDTHLDEDLRADKWAVLRSHVPKIIACVNSIPAAFQSKALGHIRQIRYFWDLPEELGWALREYEKLLPRICRPPFQEGGFEEEPLSMLTRLNHADWKRIREAPDEVFRKLESACRRKNEAELISSGLHFLSERESRHVTAGILYDTSIFLKTARLIGGLGQSIQRETLKRWLAHRLMQIELMDLSVEGLVSVMAELPKEVHALVPRKLRDHVRGKVTLKPNQIERAKWKLLEPLSGVRWRLLGHWCLEQVSSPLNPRDRDAKALHAVRFYGNINENRRALRRFLQAYFKGDKDYLRRHPVNQGWLQRQRRLNRRAWLAEMTTEGLRTDGSRVKLHLELDPLEALRLGTYMGSCTGLGGAFAYSAAAVVLDLNKRVVYARNALGTVVARQLVAVTEDEQLVCFGVYPAGVSNDLKRLFRDFDLLLASRLGLDIYKPGNESGASGKVELLLSKDWWDDGAWDLGVEDEEPGGALEAP